ncbi:hypothetical protein PMAYCL1PPCAC_31937 [Pristionchus mayeri]|uniref:Transthyretin-like family protein n=1 Tax=Pristionchus mayeri TaxID=1317129 RepID=A0AAN5DFT8_9BILA|nr:hypothetical protein PMAYCL1PPCAC_31937 [Pristionchus mayeri]
MQLLLPLTAVFVCVSSRSQFINVKGTLTCQSDTVENAQVELWEHDIFTPDDLLTSSPSDILGAFELSGADNEVRSYSDSAAYNSIIEYL